MRQPCIHCDGTGIEPEGNYPREETDGEDTMPRVAGKSFRCSCGANVFQKLTRDKSIFQCNGCNAHYKGE